MNDNIKQKIQQTLKETKTKRLSQQCKVFTVKIDSSRLNVKELNQLKMFFIEAKWLYNNILASKDPFHYDCKNTTVTILNKEKQPEQRILNNLNGVLRYRLMKSLQQNIINLSKAKKKDIKIGKLKFKSEYNSINLYRNNITHHIISHNRIKITGMKRPLVVHGLKQIKEHYEIANAKLLNKPSGYYLAITCYELIKLEPKEYKGGEIGIDFGIKSNLVTSKGEVFDISIGESERLKRLQRKYARQDYKNRSKNAYKTKLLIRRQYENITNKKKDTANKILHYLLSTYSFIYIQDEQLRQWHKDYGSKVQYSCMGMIKSKLKNSNKVKMISKWYPTTKQCYVCNRQNILSLKDRIYKCECGLVEDRDIKAAKTIMAFGKNQLPYTPPKRIKVPMESREFKLVENNISSTKVLTLVPSIVQ